MQYRTAGPAGPPSEFLIPCGPQRITLWYTRVWHLYCKETWPLICPVCSLFTFNKRYSCITEGHAVERMKQPSDKEVTPVPGSIEIAHTPSFSVLDMRYQETRLILHLSIIYLLVLLKKNPQKTPKSDFFLTMTTATARATIPMM